MTRTSNNQLAYKIKTISLMHIFNQLTSEAYATVALAA
ncbi:hypothetical protein Cpin_4393 [Chitinophaga pinensis DSM 2588]|uniref:Uncharacterized protein n=1 Tax=Chitinophaga pinensis (strain ATCC 43595 / DSM 2588 / LMG 13176 / NBRC 15968 / NCIMB 11800 / UQM 2034) TaxID=485918 RepID=A0A979G6L9_CHIPD|nr:hypothetical protein Cpin_4393 [Chitinophaga pinensis DSM 2588]